jgi:hypothetical protein
MRCRTGQRFIIERQRGIGGPLSRFVSPTTARWATEIGITVLGGKARSVGRTYRVVDSKAWDAEIRTERMPKRRVRTMSASTACISMPLPSPTRLIAALSMVSTHIFVAYIREDSTH